MEWFLPITILPAVGLLIMSTTSQMMGLSNEIAGLLSQKCTPFQHQIADSKIKQLTRLTLSTTLLYVSAALLTLSGLISAMTSDEKLKPISEYILILGVVMILFSLLILTIYSFKAIKIRRLQHQNNHKLTKPH